MVMNGCTLCWIAVNGCWMAVSGCCMAMNVVEWLWMLLNGCECFWVLLNGCERCWMAVNGGEWCWTAVNCVEWLEMVWMALDVSIFEFVKYNLVLHVEWCECCEWRMVYPFFGSRSLQKFHQIRAELLLIWTYMLPGHIMLSEQMSP